MRRVSSHGAGDNLYKHQAARTTWTDSRFAMLTTFAVWMPQKIYTSLEEEGVT